jgi:hypothetical protein
LAKAARFSGQRLHAEIRLSAGIRFVANRDMSLHGLLK